MEKNSNFDAMILIVDDDNAIRTSLSFMLKRAGYDTRTAANSHEAIAIVREETPQTEEKLFTPFFSTKPNGQGVGLVFTREVLAKHGCTFSLRTGDDGITRFRITFPKAGPAA